MKLSIIVPVYRGKRILPVLLRRIDKSLAGNNEYEVLLICDGCDRESLSIVNELKKNNSSQLKVFRLAHNYGQHRALQFGFSKVSGELVVTIDEDLQHDPADILKLVEKQKENNYDVVYGRFVNPQHNWIRNVFSAILRKILKHFIPTLYDNYSPYRLIKKDIAIRTSTMVCPFTFIDDFLSRVTQNIAFEDIEHHKRMEGESSYTFMKFIKHGFYILLAYSKLIQLLLATSIIFVIAGSVMFGLNVISLKNLNTIFFSTRFITGIMGIGMILLFFSLMSSFINHRNTVINTRPVKLLNEDPI
ncbi:MAG: glycosyltransferase [Bacteroidetes bacterium]|nr:MAG: glycosyltransferase [Bacteroidota bacterium]